MLSSISLQRVADYIMSKRGKDGGYLYYQYHGIFDSSAEDTYYAIRSLKLLNVEIPDPEETASFLRSLQRSDGRYPSLTTAYYAIKGLAEIGGSPRNPTGAIRYLTSKLEEAVMKREPPAAGSPRKEIEKAYALIDDGVLKSWDLTDELYAIEMPSRLLDLFMITEALDFLGYEIEDESSLMEAALSHKMPDGGFGVGYSSIDETFYALTILQRLGYEVTKLADTAAWIKRCEDPLGGFKVKPSITRGYSMAHLYHGLRSMSILKLKPEFRQRHLKFIEKCLNGNGGFRDSVHVGLSSLEATFHALSALAILNGGRL